MRLARPPLWTISEHGVRTATDDRYPRPMRARGGWPGGRADLVPSGRLVLGPTTRPLTEGQWNRWQEGIFRQSARAAGAEGARAYDLRHSFVSLLINEGISILEVARQAGHTPTMALEVYGHVFDELDPSERFVPRGGLGLHLSEPRVPGNRAKSTSRRTSRAGSRSGRSRFRG
ncbi:MAG: tyrosine-type recombinase/integrase [Thermoleophilaceae bacterium]|nr:tyrosine-type recombinase/integrase [Thermoleophilaceae bacterium]